MNKHIQAAIEERRLMYWEYAPLSELRPISRYQLRAEIETTERGHRVTRRLFATISEPSAERVHAEPRDAGVPEYEPSHYVPPSIPAVVGTPTKAREAARFQPARP